MRPGWASIALGRAYPRVSIDGFDLDESSIALAQADANATGLPDRVRFTMQDASQVQGDGDYDLMLAFECIHDIADPVGALRMEAAGFTCPSHEPDAEGFLHFARQLNEPGPS
jgi:cyclopropane fatty-acyl-phospholipid synthase-like methyltransferase